jgi:hypothetical protein
MISLRWSVKLPPGEQKQKGFVLDNVQRKLLAF